MKLRWVAPLPFDQQKPTHLVVYTLPNGNTIEQTAGAKLVEAMDWHFDIQHIAAQTRLLAKLQPDQGGPAGCECERSVASRSWRARRVRLSSCPSSRYRATADGAREPAAALRQIILQAML